MNTPKRMTDGSTGGEATAHSFESISSPGSARRLRQRQTDDLSTPTRAAIVESEPIVLNNAARLSAYRDPIVGNILRARRHDLGVERPWILDHMWRRFLVPMDNASLDFIETGRRMPTVHQLNAMLRTLFLVPTEGVGRTLVERFARHPRYRHVTPERWDLIVSTTMPTPAKTRLQRFDTSAGDPMAELVPLTLKITLTEQEKDAIERALLRRRVHGQTHSFTDVAKEIVSAALEAREALDYELQAGTPDTARTFEKSFRTEFSQDDLAWIRSATKGLALRTWVRLLILDRLAAE